MIEHQRKKGEAGLTIAHGAQEKTIKKVNTMTRFSMFFIIAISIGVAFVGAFFGVWIFRSIDRSLSSLREGAMKSSEGARDQLDHTSQISAAAEQMGHTISDIAQNASSAADTSAKAMEIAKECKKSQRALYQGFEGS